VNENDVPFLVFLLHKYAEKWENIGRALGFSDNDLNSINQSQMQAAHRARSPRFESHLGCEEKKKRFFSRSENSLVATRSLSMASPISLVNFQTCPRMLSR